MVILQMAAKNLPTCWKYVFLWNAQNLIPTWLYHSYDSNEIVAGFHLSGWAKPEVIRSYTGEDKIITVTNLVDF